MRFRLSIVLAALVLSSCGRPTRSVQYWKDHPQERKALLERCVALDEPGCANLRQAEFEADGIPARDGIAIVARP